MENASKALIIAGAILLSILLISLGIMIFNQAQSTIDNSGMSQVEVEAFNTDYLKFEGTGISGDKVKSLITKVLSSGGKVKAYKGNGSGVATTNLIDKTSIIITKNKYNVALTYDSYTGLVNTVVIDGTFGS